MGSATETTKRPGAFPIVRWSFRLTAPSCHGPIGSIGSIGCSSAPDAYLLKTYSSRWSAIDWPEICCEHVASQSCICSLAGIKASYFTFEGSPRYRKPSTSQDKVVNNARCSYLLPAGLSKKTMSWLMMPTIQIFPAFNMAWLSFCLCKTTFLKHFSFCECFPGFHGSLSSYKCIWLGAIPNVKSSAESCKSEWNLQTTHNACMLMLVCSAK